MHAMQAGFKANFHLAVYGFANPANGILNSHSLETASIWIEVFELYDNSRLRTLLWYIAN
jgi:hypothetical protein